MPQRSNEQMTEAEHFIKLWHEVNELAPPKSRAKREAEAAARSQRYYDPTPAPTRSDTRKAALMEPSWQHSSADAAKERPDVVFEGDELILAAKTKDIADGSGIDFIIENRGDPAPFATKQTAHDRTRNGIVKTTWKVAIKRSTNNRGEKPKLVFYADYDGFSGISKSPDFELPLFNKIECSVVEIPDVCLNAGSPVPCLDKNGLLEGALVAIFTFAKDNPTKQIVVLGHSDSKDTQADRFDNSKYSAEMIKALLGGDKQRFTEIAELCAEVSDWQANLTALNEHYDWNCDPTAINNKFGPKTKQATKDFKAQCNQKNKTNLPVDDTLGEPAWGAMFDVIRSIVIENYKARASAQALPTLAFTSDGFYPCSDSFPPDPKQKGYRSKKGRRVEVLFFNQGECPTLAEHQVKTTPVTIAECPILDNRKCNRAFVEYAPTESRSLKIRAYSGPAALKRDETGTYRVTSYNREPTEAEKARINWALFVNGSEAARYNGIGETCEFRAIGKYAGERISLHPFFNSPGQNLCVKVTVGPYLYFDGSELAWFDEAGKEAKAWKAASGEKGMSDPANANGPMPNGKYAMLQNECGPVANQPDKLGTHKIGIRPFSTTDSNGRQGLCINGGKVAGHAPGITVFDKIGELVAEFQKVGDEVVLVVESEENISDNSEYAIVYASTAKKDPKKAEDVLRAIMRASGVKSITITSTVRTPADQARILYENIETYGVQPQKELYSSSGDKVIDEYVAAKNAGKNETEIKSAMEAKIIEVGSTTVSKHCCDPTTKSIIDVAPSSVPGDKKNAFVNAIKGNTDVSKYFLPPSDPAYHIEVNL
jgi:hypothetical protein